MVLEVARQPVVRVGSGFGGTYTISRRLGPHRYMRKGSGSIRRPSSPIGEAWQWCDISVKELRWRGGGAVGTVRNDGVGYSTQTHNALNVQLCISIHLVTGMNRNEVGRLRESINNYLDGIILAGS
jgi:hypothetical protein